jgi:hypothetical protein
MTHEFLQPAPRPAAQKLAIGMAAACLGLLAGCTDDAVSQREGFAMAEVPRFNQPPPARPLLGEPVITAEQVLPHAKADPHDPLPAAVPLPAKASEPSGNADTNKQDEGGVNPAAGQAAAITDGQGEGSKYQLGAPQ